jgi:ATP-dependent DNA helicase RecG
MNKRELKDIIQQGENLTVEFKSWVRTHSMKERINLAVPELIAFANTKGGSVFFGIEDTGEVTGCSDFNSQKIIEAIYDKTRPSLFVNVENIMYEGKIVIMLHVEHDGNTYATTD